MNVTTSPGAVGAPAAPVEFPKALPLPALPPPALPLPAPPGVDPLAGDV
jgi:hypothetical protein